MSRQTIDKPLHAPSMKPDGAPAPVKRRRVGAFVAVAALAIVLAIVVWRVFFTAPAPSDNVVTLSGRIEGDDSAIAPKTAGRIVEIRVREGDSVGAGEVIATLDAGQVRAREDQARAALSAARARAQSARDQIGVLDAQLRQSQMQTSQAGMDARGRVYQASEQLAAAQAAVAQQEASYRLAAFNQHMNVELYRTGDVSLHDAKQSIANAQAAASALAAERRRAQAAHGALTEARATLSNPHIRSAESAALQNQITAQQSVVTSALDEARQALAQLSEAEANSADLVVRAPFSGTVITRAAEPGEVVSAGTPIVTLLNMHTVYLRGFIPEGQIGKIAVGQAARVYLDSDPNRPIDAYVMRIDPQATFTPENTYFREDRVKQVFGVKVRLKNGFGFAKPGMPADGEILIRGQWSGAGRSR